MTVRPFILSAVAAASSAAFGGAQTAQQRGARIGANAQLFRSYTRSREFVDLIPASGNFGPSTGPWNGNAAVGSDGWPTEDFSVTVLSGMSTVPNMSGAYTICYEGTATVALMAASAGVTLSNSRTDPTTGTKLLDLNFPSGADQVSLRFTGTGGTLKNLRVIRPGYTWNDPALPVWTPEFLEHMRPFAAVRFMDWAATNTLYTARWATRPTLSTNRTTTNPVTGAPGVPWERSIELSNKLGCDMWVTVPTTAAADYYTQLATLIKDSLRADLKVYVEYSNEVWNPTFPQYSWAATTAVNEEVAAGNTQLKWDGATDTTILRERVYAERMFRISEAFRSVFGDGAMMNRVRPVLAWQVGSSAQIDRMIDYARRIYNTRTTNEYLYAIACAPYFSIGANQTSTTQTVESIISEMQAGLNNLPRGYFYENSAYIAKKYGLHWLGYEGGPDTYGTGSLVEKKQAAGDTRMGAMCQQLLTDWYHAGGAMLMWFTAGASNWETQYGTWSAEEYLSEVGPKYQALQWASNLSAPIEPATRHVTGTAFDAAELVSNYYEVGSGNYNNNRQWWAAGQVRDYILTAPAAGTYQLSVRATCSTAPTFNVYVNGSSAPSLSDIPLSIGTLVSTLFGTVTLDKGINIIRFSIATLASATFDQILLTPA